MNKTNRKCPMFRPCGVIELLTEEEADLNFARIGMHMIKKTIPGGCQFIIATHSPFLLALPGARIYDLDETPVDIKKWWQLENPKIYYEFFERHRDKFE